jgi:hypothetical protein
MKLTRRTLIEALATHRTAKAQAFAVGYTDPRTMRKARKKHGVVRRETPSGIVIVEARTAHACA